MDDSMSSTNYMFSCAPDNSSEESGWTLYFEDFLANNNNQNYNIDNFDYSSLSSSSRYNTSSMVSDAHVNKLANNKCISKNRKATAKNCTSIDEELEDTASSPSHTPKINDLDHMYIKSKQLGAQNVSQEKVQASQRAIEDSDLGFLDIQLRRKGLCLVPMSMLLDHL